MCGICGIWDFNGGQVPAELLDQMNCKIAHRGPDDDGFLIKPGVGLAMRRLAIIDLNSGSQPISNEDQSVWVVFNGEIYNYQVLRAELAAEGHVFTTRSDTEVIVHAYEEWGMDFLKRLNGMFAIALYDEGKDELYLARDRVGKKPLYYWHRDNFFAFGSEIKSLLLIPGLNPTIDRDALRFQLMLGYTPGPFSLFEGVRKLPAGQFLRLGRAGQTGCQPELFTYWDLPEKPGEPAASNGNKRRNLDEEFRELFMDAVRLRLIADVPIGVLLSGGVDSSSVMAGVCEVGGSPLKSFSVSFLESEINEASFARTAADHFGSQHFELLVDKCTPELLQQVIWHCDEPIADPALVPTYLLSKLAAEHVKVVLTGEGADELLAGYFYHPRFKDSHWVDYFPRSLRPALITPSARRINLFLNRQRYHPRTLWGWELPRDVRVLAWSAIFTHPELQQFTNLFGSRNEALVDPVSYLHNLTRRSPKGDWLTRLMYYDLKVPLVDDLLMKVDKMSMAASLEARTPFLDYRLIEFAKSLPVNHKLNKSGNKLVLRKAMGNILPKEIAARTKHPFHVPIRRWLKEDLNELFWDSMNDRSFKELDVLDEKSLNLLWQDMEVDLPGRAHQLWLLLSLAVWAQVFKVGSR
jgi:asparagine synthase (glutamine-hydrolysing)